MRRLLTLLGLLAVVVAVASCGAGAHHRTITTTVTFANHGTLTNRSLTMACPPGGGFMGCALGAPRTYSLTPPLKLTLPPAGVVRSAQFPDVSNYQGCSIDWSIVQAPGAVVKLGESNNFVDPCAARNITGLRAIHKPVIPYWFVRPGSISAEGAAIVRALKANRITISHVLLYTAPGTWPGGSSAGLWTWEAGYAQNRPAMPFQTRLVAWQYTDSGYIAGLGFGDVSVNYSMLGLAPHAIVLDEEVPGIAGYAGPLAHYILTHDPAPKPKPKPKPKVRRVTHPAVYYDVFLNATIRLDGRRLNERQTVERFDRKPSKVLQADIRLLAGRVYQVANYAPDGHRYRHPQWGVAHRGSRFQLLEARARQKG